MPLPNRNADYSNTGLRRLQETLAVCGLMGGWRNSLRRLFALRYRQGHPHSADVPDEPGKFTSHSNDRNLPALSSGHEPAISATQAELGIPGPIDNVRAYCFLPALYVGAHSRRMLVS